MATSPSSSESAHATPPEESSRLLKRLDGLLSSELRKASPTELVRHRFLVGAACFLLGFNTLFMVSSVYSPARALPGVIACGGFLATLIMARKAKTLVAPAMVLVTTLSVGFVIGIFLIGSPQSGLHAATMLLPLLAVYLLGPRLGLLMTLVLAAALMGGYPFYLVQKGLPPTVNAGQLVSSYVIAALAFMGAWWLGSLSSTSRDSAQRSLEHALKVLRENEGKLSSVIESTDDIVLSLDTEGRVLTANSAAQRMYEQRFGLKLEPGGKVSLEQERAETWRQRIAQVLRGDRLRLEEVYLIGERHIVLDLQMSPILGEGGKPVGLTLFGRDITARKEAEARLGEVHRTLVDVSRQAGMAEVATGVLHNVGNTLNSVNISASVVTDQLRKSRLGSLAKATHLLREHANDFTSFLTQDPQGQKLPSYLIALSDQLQEERQALLQEMHSLGESIEHIKSIVSMQQKHARAAGAVEEVGVPQLIDEALRLHTVSFERQGIHIERDYGKVPPIQVDRHKLLQILVNLLSNALHALAASSNPDKRLSIHVRLIHEQRRMLIEVEDNGIGIPAENLQRLFAQGFTTRKEGHGFGLHISALSATELKGRISCSSAGPGQGATFTLELPVGTDASAV